jgi:hypothetical protein
MKINQVTLGHDSLSGYAGIRGIVKLLIVLILLNAASYCRAVTVVSGPFFTPADNAPLAGVLSLTTDVGSQVSISVSDGSETWERDFFDYGTNHTLTLLGFKPDETNEITVTVRDQYRNTFTVSEPLEFITSPLPVGLPTITLVTNNPAKMEPGYTLFRVSNNSTGGACSTLVDSSGQIVWYDAALPGAGDLKQLPNGDLFFPENTTTNFDEANMLGEIITNWSTPLFYPSDGHEDLLTDHNTILYISLAVDTISNFPSSATDSNAPLATTNIEYDRVVEISTTPPQDYSTNYVPLNQWSMIGLLDPTRIDYLCYAALGFFGVDPEHANAVIESTNDDSLIVSLRNQDAVVKFTRSGELKWILGSHQNWGPEWQPFLLTPVGTPFAWNYAQHAPVITPQGTILLYDDGNCRAEPFDPPVPDQENYSRAVEFKVDETNMTVSQVWQYTGTNDEVLYTGALGNATYQPKTGNVLMTFGYVSYENGVHPIPIAPSSLAVHLKEVTHDADPSVVFDLRLSDEGTTNAASLGFTVYRCHRIPDLYGHPATAVANMTFQIAAGSPTLQFTADPANSYLIQASTDLVNWSSLGAPTADDATGNFSFTEPYSSSDVGRYYRIISQ